jgi:hypothetical protein
MGLDDLHEVDGSLRRGGESRQKYDEAAEEYRRYLMLNLLHLDQSIVPNLAIGMILHYPYFEMQGKADEKEHC